MCKVSFNQEICYTNRKLVFIVGLLYLSCNGDALSPKVTWIKGVDSKSYRVIGSVILSKESVNLLYDVWSDSRV